MAKGRIQRRLAAILAADVEGYSRLMRADEEATLETLVEYREIIDGLIARHDGRVFSTGGDSVLAEFGSVVEAVRCAISFQEELTTRNTELPDDRRLRFRIGINVGDVMVKDDDLFGDGVNVAARLEGLAESGGICISGSVFEQIKHKLSLGFEDLGPQEVKNISEPVSAFRIVPGSVTVAAGAGTAPRSAAPARWRTPAIMVLAVLVIGAAAALWRTSLRPPQAPRQAKMETDAAVPIPDKPPDAIRDDSTGKVASSTPKRHDRPRKADAVNREALDLFTRAKGLDPSAKKNVEAARQMFERAIELDPKFAGGYAGLSWTHSMTVQHSYSASPRDDAKKAFELAQTAIAIDDSFGWSHSALARAYLIDGQFDQAIRSAEKAVQLQPNDADAHANLALTLMFAGRAEDAIAPARKALSLKPRLVAFSTGPYLNFSGFAYFTAGWYEEAVAAFEENLSRGGPIGVEALAYATAAYSVVGRADDARVKARELLREHPEFSTRTWPWLRLYKNPEDSKRLSNALHKAGVPR